MLYRFSICRKGSPPCRFKLVSGADTGCKDSWKAAGLYLDNSRAAQLGFSLLLVLPAASWNSSSGNLLPNEAADLVGWDSQKNQLHSLIAPTNPSPPNLKPQPSPNKTPTTAMLHKY